MSYENLFTIVRTGEPHLDSANGYEILGEEFMDCCYWDEELKREMYERLTARVEFPFHTVIAGI